MRATTLRLSTWAARPHQVMAANLLLPIVLLLLSPGSDSLALYRKWSRSPVPGLRIPVPGLRIQALRSLNGQRGDRVRAALVSFLNDSDVAVVAAARRAIVARPNDEGASLVHLIAALDSERGRRAGLRALLLRGDELTPLARSESARVRARVVASGCVAPDALDRALRDRDPRVRAIAWERHNDPSSAPTLAKERAEELRIAAARLTDEPAILVQLLRDRSWRVQLAAIRACERVRHRDLVPALIDALRMPPGRVRARCAQTLESLTGAPYGGGRARWQRWWKMNSTGFRVRAPVAGRARRKPGGSVASISFRRLPVVSRRIVFVLDASRSMTETAPHKKGKRRWDLVVDDLLGVLRRLPRDARFNVVLFRTDVVAWKPKLVGATKGNVRRCAEWIGKQSPAGWTNVFDALELALADDDVDAVYLLTDGVPSRGAETKRRAFLEEIAFLNRYRLVQINCVQAGSSEGLGARWRGFLDELAAAHDGLCVRE